MAAARPFVFLARFGPPGSYVVSMLVAIVRAGSVGVVWGTAFPFVGSRWTKPRKPAEVEWTEGWRRTAVAPRRGEPPADEAGRATVADNLPAVRRGALIGPLVGTPLFAALIGVAVHVGRVASAVGFAAVLVAVLAVAAVTARRERRLRARLR
ncbi:hypothetical protein [Micromonospora sp. WMMD980]|uniref:hypothetical protein n=1 Tax=Micromonospora sp. WMMD980 TaxID=3016088 RepID=UPI00241736C4|nr:hypothetical protein [Micromonospora sp. WMMD980]MDG4802221.1 hypothetical protein [Micromonospora sp. WMMD980]